VRRGDVADALKSVGLAQAAGAVGGLGQASSSREWYDSLSKPAFTPPGFVFPPVWTALYTLMGLARFIVRRQAPAASRRALIAWNVQLALNALWPIVFFTARRPGWGFIELLLLWIAVLITVVWFLRLSRLAGGLLIPYLLWVSFAGALNFTIWLKNR
jgi:translocator protein